MGSGSEGSSGSMRPLRHLATLAAFALSLGLLAPSMVRADDPPPGSPPAPAPEQTAALGRAEALDRQVEDLYGKGKYAEATPLARESLALREKALGKDHPDVALSLNNLALLLQDQGAYAEARPLHDRALAIREKALGMDHPDVAPSLHNLASLLCAQGAYAEARPLFAQRQLHLGVDDNYTSAFLPPR